MGTAGSRRSKHKLGAERGRLEIVGDCGSIDGNRFGGNFSPLNFATAPLVLGWEDVDYGQVGEGGAVLYGLDPGYISSSHQEHNRPGPVA